MIIGTEDTKEDENQEIEVPSVLLMLTIVVMLLKSLPAIAIEVVSFEIEVMLRL